MNASYKIVLLGAFVLFIAVIGYYTLSGSGDADVTAGDQLAQQTPPTGGNGQGTTPPPSNPPTRPGDDGGSEPGPDSSGGEVVIDDPGDNDPGFEFPPSDGGSDPGTSGTDDGTTDDGRDGPPADGATTPPPIDDGGGIAGLDDGREGPPPIGDGPSGIPGDTDDGTADSGDGTSDDTGDPGTSDTGDADPDTDTGDSGDTATARNYTIKPGDNFSKIAEEVYGDASKWYEISQANPSVDPTKLQVGQVIVLPALATADDDTADTGDDEPRPVAPGQNQSYTVQPNDNLSKIAKQFYGDETKWELIYARNRKTIGERPGMLKVGMKLVIPPPYDGAE